MPLITRQKRDIYNHGVDLFNQANLTGVRIAGTPEETMVRFTTDEVFALHRAIQQVYDAHHLSSAYGSDLDVLGEPFGVSRKTTTLARDDSPVNEDGSDKNVTFYIDTTKARATKAKQLVANYNITSGQIRIPENTMISNNGEKAYYTTKAVVFPDEAADVGVPVTAAGTGRAYNVATDELNTCDLSRTDLPAAVQALIKVRNRLPIDSGQDRELDDDYRFRIAQAYIAKAAGNEKALLDAARNVPGVRNAFLIPYLYGTGTVGVFVESSTPVVSRGTMRAVQAACDRAGSSGNRIYTLYPTFLGVGLKIEVRSVPGATIEGYQNDLKQQIITAINALDRGETLVISQIMAIVAGHSQVADGQIALLTIGEYDIDTQQRQNVAQMLPVNQESSSMEQWFTAEQYIEICEV